MKIRDNNDISFPTTEKSDPFENNKDTNDFNKNATIEKVMSDPCENKNDTIDIDKSATTEMVMSNPNDINKNATTEKVTSDPNDINKNANTEKVMSDHVGMNMDTKLNNNESNKKCLVDQSIVSNENVDNDLIPSGTNELNVEVNKIVVMGHETSSEVNNDLKKCDVNNNVPENVSEMTVVVPNIIKDISLAQMKLMKLIFTRKKTRKEK